jgi:ferredoxin-NADP reductase/ferredoxin
MSKLYFNDTVYECTAQETVLDAFVRQGVAIPFSCRNGVCQTCMMQSAEANVPRAAQNGLKPTLQFQNYFLACVCHPTEDMTVSLIDSADRLLSATVTGVLELNAEIKCVNLDCSSMGDYRPGQFINLYQNDECARSYSLASMPTDGHLQLHVRRLANGRVSNWIHDELKVGDNVQISTPVGSCFYLPDAPHQPLLLIGTGSGLAPLIAIARDALHQQHSGDIYLYHGSRDVAGLYLVDELRAMTEQYSNFHYIPCVSGAEIPESYQAGRAVDVALSDHRDLKGWRVFLCGNPDMVQSGRKKAYLAKAALNDIYADSFLLTNAL